MEELRPHDNLFTCRWNDKIMSTEKRNVNIISVKLLFRSWCLSSGPKDIRTNVRECISFTTTSQKKLHGFSSCYWKDIFFSVVFRLDPMLHAIVYVCWCICTIAKVYNKKNGDTFACDDFNGRIIDSVYL